MDKVLLIDCKIKVGDVLNEHGGLLHVLPIAVHLTSVTVKVEGTILGLRVWGPGLDNRVRCWDNKRVRARDTIRISDTCHE